MKLYGTYNSSDKLLSGKTCALYVIYQEIVSENLSFYYFVTMEHFACVFWIAKVIFENKVPLRKKGFWY